MKKQKQEKCEEIIGNRRCRNDYALTVVGKKMCDPCWARHCEGN